MLSDDIQWQEMIERAPSTKEQSFISFGDLANSFRVLHRFCPNWNEDDVISVLEELTSKYKYYY